MPGPGGSGNWCRGSRSGSDVAKRKTLRNLVEAGRRHVGAEPVPARARKLNDTLERRSMWTGTGSLQVWARPIFFHLSQFKNDAHWRGMC